ncbi:hypothetical protein ZIOFF_027171 [Zingiber officinale]|uniref:Uncharacterized protein n=1 Tax=Zingiber officinale TaxID=94328 RepID=A0A8J5GXD6_ZINOF|nr:hypothetical protein ZIOFF_027171 [Zingiber officinale]
MQRTKPHRSNHSSSSVPDSSDLTMAAAAPGGVASSSNLRFPSSNYLSRRAVAPPSAVRFLAPSSPPCRGRLRISLSSTAWRHVVVRSDRGGGYGGSDGGHGGGGGDGGEGGDSGENNRAEALLVLAKAERTLESLPKDLAAAIENGRIPGLIVRRFFELERSPVFRWLLQFGGFKERLLADDLFLAKVAMECGVGVFTKVMAIVADFMLVWLPAPTVSLRAPLLLNTGPIAKFFYSCPDNAFQIALAGTSYSFLQRAGAILRNGSKLFVVGTGASLIGTGVTNALIKARQAIDKDVEIEAEDVPIVSTSVAYGVYMAISSNLRYQVLAGVIEQRILEPLLHNQKLALSALCFAVRTGNTFLGSLLWVDYARWVGVQKSKEHESSSV